MIPLCSRLTKRKEVEKIITDVFTSFDFIYRVEYEEFNADEIDATACL